eukprot:6181912-Pleurochrysis_carterae.AAC.1
MLRVPGVVHVPGDAHARVWVPRARPQCSPVCPSVSCSTCCAACVLGDARVRAWASRLRPQYSPVCVHAGPRQSTPVHAGSRRGPRSSALSASACSVWRSVTVASGALVCRATRARGRVSPARDH